jgi:hypothetical protein
MGPSIEHAMIGANTQNSSGATGKYEPAKLGVLIIKNQQEWDVTSNGRFK